MLRRLRLGVVLALLLGGFECAFAQVVGHPDPVKLLASNELLAESYIQHSPVGPAVAACADPKLE